MANTIEEHAAKAYRQLQKHHRDPFDMKVCRIFTVSEDGKLEIISHHRDVYEGLTSTVDLAIEPVMQRMRFLGIDTCGWAAPATPGDDNRQPPSEHPDRRRVRIVVMVDRNLALGSAMGFEDDPAELVMGGSDEAGGSLAEELVKTIAGIIFEQAVAE